MRPLLVLNGVAGLLLGLAATGAWHYARRHDGGWFAYAPFPQHARLHVTWQGGWFPEIVVIPAAGLLLGVAVAGLLHRLGWRLVRSDRSRAEA